jgi:hypothetical protein
MLRQRFFLVWIIAIGLTAGFSGAAEVTDQQVQRAIQRAVARLKATQNERGGWDEFALSHGGVSALCTLALLNAGVPLDDPVMQRGLNLVRKMNADRTYAIALQTMVLATATPNEDRLQIRENVLWLQRNQVKSGRFKGGWFYGETPATADNSNSQFALLALYEAERVGVEVDEQVWNLALSYWLRQQADDGAWEYMPNSSSARLSHKSGSMTCAGIASVMIASGQVARLDAQVVDGKVQCCGAHQDIDAVERGLGWLSKHFSVRRNPSPQADSRQWWLYYLYGMERVARLSGQRFIGQHDWFREGAEVLVESQDSLTGTWIGADTEAHPPLGTALGLLFLSKGRRPVLIGKLKHSADQDWNRHRHDMAHLTRHVEKLWDRDLSWQTIDVEAASAEDLLQAPVLMISGRTGLRLTEQQKQNLKTYVAQGGFIFAEACCDGQGFDRDFRALAAELFPDSPLRLLPPEHPVWYAEQKVNPAHLRPLYGVEACCRTSIVYCPGELSCYWELAGERQLKQYPGPIKEEIDACLAIGGNVITYATNRVLREKLDTPFVASSDVSIDLPRATLNVAKLLHAGGSDDAPAALGNLLRAAAQQLQLRISTEKHLLPPTSPSLPDHPIAFMHGRRGFELTDSERKALARYIENGGFLMADSICASRAFADSFRREMRAIFPEQTLEQIRPDHPLFSTAFQGYDITSVQLRDPAQRLSADDRLTARIEKVAPVLEGIEMDGRLVVVFSPFDLSCALENQASLECKGYLREDAVKIGVNIMLFAMQQ